MEARLTAPVSERMLDLAALAPGMRVLDLATGRGEPALRAAQRVGPQGMVLGIEPSEGVLRLAREAAARAGLTNIEFRVTDAERMEGLADGYFDAVTARWGLMYMADPVAALIRARRALAPTGVLVAALWAEPERVPYHTLPRRLLARHRPPPEFDPEAPGTFRYADPERIARDFARAGMALDHREETAIPVFEAETGAEVVAWARALGMDRLLDVLSDEERRAWEEEFSAELERNRSGGRLRLGGVTRIVRAHPA